MNKASVGRSHYVVFLCWLLKYVENVLKSLVETMSSYKVDFYMKEIDRFKSYIL